MLCSSTSNRRLAWTLLAVVATVSGCAQGGTRRTLVSSEPPLISSEPAGPSTIVQAPPARNVSFADRHPLFTRPREYYDQTSGGRVGKTAAATVIGVPAGIVGEFRQIIRGTPTMASRPDVQENAKGPVARLQVDTDGEMPAEYLPK